MQCPVEIHQLLNKPLTTHSWNAERTKIAVATISEFIYVFKRDQQSTKWTQEIELKAHEQQITGLDWCKRTDRLVSCSMDRNVYVWNPSKAWKPTLVALNFSKAVSCVCWSPKGDKFAAGAADGSIAVAYYDAENDWWIGKLAKQPLKNTITALAWHPNNQKLLAACVDGRVLTCSGFIKAVDGDKEAESEEAELSFKYTHPPVLNVSFSPSGNRLAWTNYDGTCTIATVESNDTETVQVAEWPMLQVNFLSEKLILCTGHAYDPILLGFKEGKWAKIDLLLAQRSDVKKTSASNGFGSAMAKFKSLDNCGVEEVTSASKGRSGHYNTVNKISVLSDASGRPVQVSTSSLDGNLIIWSVNEVIANNGLSQLSL